MDEEQQHKQWSISSGLIRSASLALHAGPSRSATSRHRFSARRSMLSRGGTHSSHRPFHTLRTSYDTPYLLLNLRTFTICGLPLSEVNSCATSTVSICYLLTRSLASISLSSWSTRLKSTLFSDSTQNSAPAKDIVPPTKTNEYIQKDCRVLAARAPALLLRLAPIRWLIGGRVLGRQDAFFFFSLYPARS